MQMSWGRMYQKYIRPRNSSAFFQRNPELFKVLLIMN